MALSNNAETNRLVSRPFIIYSGTDLTGTATGDAEVRNYCALPYTSASRYQLDRPDHNNIFQFRRTINGVTEKAYCLINLRMVHIMMYLIGAHHLKLFSLQLPSAKSRCWLGFWQITILL